MICPCSLEVVGSASRLRYSTLLDNELLRSQDCLSLTCAGEALGDDDEVASARPLVKKIRASLRASKQHIQVPRGARFVVVMRQMSCSYILPSLDCGGLWRWGLGESWAETRWPIGVEVFIGCYARRDALCRSINTIMHQGTTGNSFRLELYLVLL